MIPTIILLVSSILGFQMSTEYSLLPLITLSIVFWRDLSVLLSFRHRLCLLTPAAGDRCALNRVHTDSVIIQIYLHLPID